MSALAAGSPVLAPALSIAPHASSSWACKAATRTQARKQASTARAAKGHRGVIQFARCSTEQADCTGSQAGFKFKPFIGWAASNGLKGQGLGYATGEAYERGLVAQTDLLQGQPLLAVPYSLALTDDPNLLDPPSPYAPHWAVILALRVLQERRRGSTSKWSQYLSSLPENVPALWLIAAQHLSKGELSTLEGELLQEVQYGVTIRQAELMATDVCKTYEKVGSAALMGASLDEFLWAVSMVHSRNFGIEKSGKMQHMLMPLADMLNHGGEELDVYSAETRAGSTTAAETHNLEWRADASNDELYFISTKPLQQGEEALLSYGDRSNDHWLLYYGFVPKNNPHDDVVLFESLDEVITWYEANEKALHTSGIDKPWEQRVQEARSAVDNTTRAIADLGDSELVNSEPRLKLVSGSKVDARLVAALVGLSGHSNLKEEKDKPGKGEDPEMPDLEHAYLCIRVRAQQMLDNMPTTLQEDICMLAADTSEGYEDTKVYWMNVWKQTAESLQGWPDTLEAVEVNGSSGTSYEKRMMMEYRACKKLILTFAIKDLVV